MRGFFGGLFIGLVTLAGAVVVLSLLSPMARTPDVVVDVPASAGSEAQGSAGAGVTPRGTDGDLVELAPTALGSGDTATDNLSLMDGADTQPGDKPRIGGATSGLTGPGTAPQVAGIAVNSDVVVAPTRPSVVPTALQGDTAPTAPTAISNPAQPTLPDVSQTGSGFGAGNAEAEASPEISSAPSTTSASGVNVAPVPNVAQQSPQEPTLPIVSAPGAGQESQVAALPQTNPGQESLRPTIGTPVVPLTERALGGGVATPTTAVATGATADQTPTGPALEVFSAAFDNPDSKPVMAIVLIDDEGAVGTEALIGFPYPLTFAIDPASRGAAAKMAARRAAGFEVVALIDLPSVATAQDAEVTLSVWLQTLSEAVAVLEGTDSGIQGSRDLSDQVTDIVDSAGLGLIMQSKGLNTAHKLAVRAGVPSALVFRDFDGDGQSPDVIRRFLDQAAFRAGQQGGVIMLGRVRPDTISALLLWGLQDRASRVALAPVSVVLSRAP